MMPPVRTPVLSPMPGLPRPRLLAPPWEKLSRGKLSIAMPLSIALHALLLLIHFTPDLHRPPPSNLDTLEVVLVNARHVRTPQDATLLGQHNLDAGGMQDREARPSTPLPPQPVTREGDSLMDATRRQPQQTTQVTPAKVLTSPAADGPARTVRTQPKPMQEDDTPPVAPNGRDEQDSTATALDLQAEIARSLEAYAKRPQPFFIGSRVKEYALATYVDQWRQKVERIGTLNFPVGKRGKLYGRLVLTVVINENGSVDKVFPAVSSGNAELDFAAQMIVRKAAPFGAITEAEREACHCNQIVITRTWTFTNEGTLQTDADAAAGDAVAAPSAPPSKPAAKPKNAAAKPKPAAKK